MDLLRRRGIPASPARSAKSILVINRVTDVPARLPSHPVFPIVKLYPTRENCQLILGVQFVRMCKKISLVIIKVDMY